jgi:hypothetical protein
MPSNSARSSRLPRATWPTKRSSGHGGAVPLTFVVNQRDHMDKSRQRIHAALGDDNERTSKNARRYLVHLKKHLSLPLCVTGIEDFPWEEPYVFGGWDRTM